METSALNGTNVNEALELWGKNKDPKDKMKIRQIQQLILEEVGDYWKNDPYEVVGYLQDFPNWSPEKIANLFKEMVQYRKENNIDTLMDRYTPPPEMGYMPAFMLKDMDRDGDPIYVTRVGAWRAMDMINDPRIGADGLLQYTQFLQEYVGTRYLGKNVPSSWNWQTEYFEKNVHDINPNRRRYKQFTSVFDMEGLNWSQHLKSPLFDVMGIMSRRGQDYYAGTAKRVIILRAPRMFKMAWNMVKHFVDPQMQELIEISSAGDYLDVWDKYMTRESLPTCMGNPDPTRNDCEEMMMPGYFQHVKMEGGSIPQNIPYKDIKKDVATGAATTRMETASLTDDESLSGGDEQQQPLSLPKVSARSFSLLRGHLDPITDQVVFQN